MSTKDKLKDELLAACSSYELDSRDIVTVRDVRHLLRIFGHRTSEEEFREIFEILKMLQTGCVPFVEFLTLMTEKVTEMLNKQNLLKDFHLIDSETKGYITANELQAVLQHAGVDVPKREVVKLMELADENSCETLNYKRFLEKFN